MQNQRIYKRRIEQFIKRIHDMRYSEAIELKASMIYHKDTPIPYEKALKATYKPVKIGAE